jgi:hypothetical protein
MNNPDLPVIVGSIIAAVCILAVELWRFIG